MQPATSTTSTTTATRTAVPFRKAHPIRGILWGFVMGLGATVIAILLKIIPLDIAWAAAVLLGGVVLGILWSTLGPAKKPKGVPPWQPDEVVGRPDWDGAAPAEAPRRRGGAMPPTGPIPPSGPIPPGVEPLLIQPLDVEPLDLEPPAADVPPASDVPPEVTPEALPTVSDEPADAAVDPPRTIDPPDRSEPSPPPPPPPSSPPPPPPPPPA